MNMSAHIARQFCEHEAIFLTAAGIAIDRDVEDIARKFADADARRRAATRYCEVFGDNIIPADQALCESLKAIARFKFKSRGIL